MIQQQQFPVSVSFRTSGLVISPRAAWNQNPLRPPTCPTTPTPTKCEYDAHQQNHRLRQLNSLSTSILNVFVLRSKSERASDSGDSDNNNNTGEEGGEEAEDEDDEYDEEYVPEWHEDYDEDDIDEDDFFSDDDESENLERDFSPFD